MTCGKQGEMPAEIARASRFFPIIDQVAAYLRQQGVLKGVTVGWHCHLTWLTALSADALLQAGAQVFLSECNPETSESDAVQYMKGRGAQVYVGPDSTEKVLAAEPLVLSDTGLVLVLDYLRGPQGKAVGACEITTSGITRLREQSDLPLPVVNINDGQLKTQIENFHGVGDGVVDGLFRMTGKMWAGRAAAVVGYGRVGAGVAQYLQRLGAPVAVVDTDPIRRLVAHYDGFVLCSLDEAMAGSELVVTATGREKLIGRQQWLKARDGLLVVNVGHWRQEVCLEDLKTLAEESTRLSAHLQEFTVAGADGKKKKILLATGGNPANVVLLSGSAEPTLIHLTTELLCLSFLVKAQQDGISLPPGEMQIPTAIERQASLFALKALGLHVDINLSPELVSRDRTC